MLTSQETIQECAKKYAIPETDALLIALNCSGVTGPAITDNRIRFKLKINGSDDLFFMALCVDTAPTSFSIEDNRLLLNNQPIGSVINIENDTCTESYFRRDKTSLTLNSNSRSQCQLIGVKIYNDINLHNVHGARHASAVLMSLNEGILMVGIVGYDYKPYLFIKGNIFELSK